LVYYGRYHENRENRCIIYADGTRQVGWVEKLPNGESVMTVTPGGFRFWSKKISPAPGDPSDNRMLMPIPPTNAAL